MKRKRWLRSSAAEKDVAVKLEKNNAHGTKMKMRRPRKSRRIEKSI